MTMGPWGKQSRERGGREGGREGGRGGRGEREGGEGGEGGRERGKRKVMAIILAFQILSFAKKNIDEEI